VLGRRRRTRRQSFGPVLVLHNFTYCLVLNVLVGGAICTGDESLRIRIPRHMRYVIKSGIFAKLKLEYKGSVIKFKMIMPAE
jgi:hypothetical protein